jgi:hypothetical protein
MNNHASTESGEISSAIDSRPTRAERSARGGEWLAWPVVLAAVVLAAAVVVQHVHIFRQDHRSSPPHLARALPAEIPGWTSRDLALGANEYLKSEAEKVLNFDDVVFREFSHGDESFAVYVAYWGAGKMPTRMVASHTPDRCWTENGWRCLALKFKQPEAVDGAPLQPAEWREFEPPDGGKPTYVLYWHLVEGRLYDYGSRFNAVPDPVRWWKDAVQQAILGSREQYFIRITSGQPLENLWRDPGFAEVLRRLAQLGLAARATHD